MNAYVSDLLAHDHIAMLQAEAERDRLARELPRRPSTPGAVSWLLDRVRAVGHGDSQPVLATHPAD